MTAGVKEFIIFSDSKSAFQAISGQDWTHPLVLYILERLNWLAQCQEKRILFRWIPSHVGIRGNEKADAAAKAGLSRRVTNVPIPYGTKWPLCADVPLSNHPFIHYEY